MARLGEQEMARRVRNELLTYLRSGTINEGRIAETLDISGLQIENLDRLKRIHFCLSDPVVTFVDQLDDELRRIKTANQRERVVSRGEIRGQVDWEETTQLRYSASGGDRTHFACETPYTEYDISENLVLKKLLWLIHTTVESDLSEIDYGWRTSRWSEDRISDYIRLYGRNVHLDRIRDGADITVTPRMLSKTRSARQSLYRDAYELYDRYERLLANADDTDVRELLQDTLVVPERIPKLFELFCVFQLLRQLDLEGLQLQVIEPNSRYLARLETDSRDVRFYHDRIGSLSFYVALDDIGTVSEDYFQRYLHAIEHHDELLASFLDIEVQESMYSGRPDLVIESYDTTNGRRNLTDVVLGEIKYTTSGQTFSTGLKQLLEYMEFAQTNGEYLSDQDVGIHGLLMTDAVDAVSKRTAGSVTHLTADELSDEDLTRGWIPDALRAELRR